MTEHDAGGERPAEQAPSAGDRQESLTQGGYSYTLVNDDAPVPPLPAKERGPRNWRPLLLAALAIVPAVIVGVAVWFLASDNGGGGDDRAVADVGNVINAFSQGQQGATVHRYEGALPPNYPDDIPTYPGADLVASILQSNGDSAGYLVVYDTKDNRDDVAAYFRDKFDQDPWQVDAGRDGRDSSLQQFSKIDDADLTGLVLSASSKDEDVTTIVVSVQVASGAKASNEEFKPGVSKPLPQDFPGDFPQYPDAIVIESAFQNQPRNDSFIVSMITRDGASAVLDYYRGQFQDKGWTVADGDATNSDLADAQAITFTQDKGPSGTVISGQFPEDKNYTQIDLQVSVDK